MWIRTGDRNWLNMERQLGVMVTNMGNVVAGDAKSGGTIICNCDTPDIAIELRDEIMESMEEGIEYFDVMLSRTIQKTIKS